MSSDPCELSREEIAQQEIGHTEIRPATAWLLTIAFLATIVLVPTVQAFYESRAENSRLPFGLSLFGHVPRAWQQHAGEEQGFARIFGANSRLSRSIHEYERQLEDRSLLGRAVLPSLQSLLATWGGAGNEQVYLGRDGWLFYRPDVDYVTGPGFLTPPALHRRAQSATDGHPSPQPDPRLAILDFHRQLKARGIQLILLPVPAKPMLDPEHLSSRYAGFREALQNPSFDQFRHEVEGAGVIVIDAASVLLENKRDTGRPQYLATDTHWTPEGMERVAAELARQISGGDLLPIRSAVKYGRRPINLENRGDLDLMLKLPEKQALFQPERVTVQQVLVNGHPWQPDADADVLLLGDSFTNIYSLEEMNGDFWLEAMNWGFAAGLAEQLSFTLQRPVDQIAQNDAGAFATRQTLAQEIGRGTDRLAGKRVVIWEFAMRELAQGDWKLIELPVPSAPRKTIPEELVVEARVVESAVAPKPGTVPYRDAIVAVHVTVMTGSAEAPGKDAVVYLWSMKDNRLTAGAGLRPGDLIRLKLVPWSTQSWYGRFARVELDDPDFKLVELPTFWGELVP